MALWNLDFVRFCSFLFEVTTQNLHKIFPAVSKKYTRKQNHFTVHFRSQNGQAASPLPSCRSYPKAQGCLKTIPRRGRQSGYLEMASYSSAVTSLVRGISNLGGIYKILWHSIVLLNLLWNLLLPYRSPWCSASHCFFAAFSASVIGGRLFLMLL